MKYQGKFNYFYIWRLLPYPNLWLNDVGFLPGNALRKVFLFYFILYVELVFGARNADKFLSFRLSHSRDFPRKDMLWLFFNLNFL